MVKYNKKVITYGVFLVITVLLLVLGLTYAFFTAGVEGNEDADENIVITGTLQLEFTDTSLLTLNDALPGASANKIFIVKMEMCIQ